MQKRIPKHRKLSKFYHSDFFLNIFLNYITPPLFFLTLQIHVPNMYIYCIFMSVNLFNLNYHSFMHIRIFINFLNHTLFHFQNFGKSPKLYL